ncbi:hypothetical protein Cgig2_024607 [Carnegiea gigantea]|uniref:Glutathione S-transferase n=1 Tax=Carnegiea gigantea TaxID=171969 RepID=A0A9Q1K824_9CARY|nr:hypothetical protein Cgig2_024607 [Carnegiea gigantea]
MGEAKESVKLHLHGMWASPWVRRVEIALKIKGIPYDYFEEDLKNKSQMLLQYNPVKKLVPVLVHHGRPISESLIIMEYIDETWNNSPNLLPLDAHHRATVRFWTHFLDLQIFEKLRDVIKTRDDVEAKKVIKEVQENMGKLEVNVRDLWSCSNGKSMGVLDILIATLLPIVEGVEDAINTKFIDAETFPLTFSWMRSYEKASVVEETIPNHENLVKFLQKLRHYFRKQTVSI